ncbi:MAG: heme-binding protein [Crocinitomicaceae bacterium]|jgi:uncharacterized protein GlcG (DUF336 family)|tara:strand:- start:2981 stop:3403 length:423 start_codon:yes stop_codon:yes gene_type:complete
MNTFSKKELTIESCLNMYHQAIKKANEIGFKIAVTICDTGGNTKLFCRMDNAPLIASDISRKKAVTAVGFGMGTGQEWHDFIKDDPILNGGAHDIDDFMLLGGGKPIYINDELVGAIGISGGHYTQDEACCDAALTAVNL